MSKTKKKPLVLTKEFPAGSIVKPDVAPVIVVYTPPPACPYCKGVAEYTSRTGSTRYYKCTRCVDPETMDFTRFKAFPAR